MSVFLLRPTLALSAMAIVAVAGCSSNKGGDDDWVLDTPEAHGVSSVLLDQAAEGIDGIAGRQCFSVIKDGVLIYDKNYKHEANTANKGFSLTKTFGSVLVGIAEHQGYLSVDDRVSDWLPKLPSGMNENATIGHVLGQTSESDPVGSGFSYNSGAVIDSLGQVITAATGMGSDEFARLNLLEPLNMQYTTWKGGSDGSVPIGYGVESSCRDIARLGQLLLNGGSWNGQPILSVGYVGAMSTPSYPEANSNYGYLTWLNYDAGDWHRPITNGTGKMIDNAPENIYMATGFLGQLIIVIPDHNMVITTMGVTAQLETLNTLKDVWDAFLPVVESL